MLLANFYLLLSLFALSTLPALLDAVNNSAEAVCKRVHAASALDKSPIFCIGRLAKSLLVITRDHLVFELPVDSLNQSINSLYFGNQAPVPWEKKWPFLTRYAHYQEVKNLIFQCITVRDKASEYITLVTWHIKTEERGVSVDLHRKNAFLGYKYLDDDDKTRWISSANINLFYEVTNDAKGLLLRDNEFCNQYTSDIHGVPCYDFPHCNLFAPDCINETPQRYPLCLKGDDGVYVDFKKSADCKPANWRVWNGFVDEGQFYLFGKDYVFTFPESAYKNPNTPVTVRRVPFGDFIKCGGNPNARDMDVTKKSPVAFGLIVAIILIIVLCCLCCLLCLIREAMASRKRKRKGKKGKHSSAIGNPFAGGAVSRRSTGLPGIGALTAMVSGGSKRSKAGPSRAGELSRKGVPRTKRSVGAPSRGQSLTRKGPSGHSATTQGSSNRSAGTHKPGRSISRGASVGRSGANNATGRSGLKGHTNKRSTSKHRGVSGHSNKATQRPKMRK